MGNESTLAGPQIVSGEVSVPLSCPNATLLSSSGIVKTGGTMSHPLYNLARQFLVWTKMQNIKIMAKYITYQEEEYTGKWVEVTQGHVSNGAVSQPSNLQGDLLGGCKLMLDFHVMSMIMNNEMPTYCPPVT